MCLSVWTAITSRYCMRNLNSMQSNGRFRRRVTVQQKWNETRRNCDKKQNFKHTIWLYNSNRQIISISGYDKCFGKRCLIGLSLAEVTKKEEKI